MSVVICRSHKVAFINKEYRLSRLRSSSLVVLASQLKSYVVVVFKQEALTIQNVGATVHISSFYFNNIFRAYFIGIETFIRQIDTRYLQHTSFNNQIFLIRKKWNLFIWCLKLLNIPFWFTMCPQSLAFRPLDKLRAPWNL